MRVVNASWFESTLYVIVSTTFAWGWPSPGVFAEETYLLPPPAESHTVASVEADLADGKLNTSDLITAAILIGGDESTDVADVVSTYRRHLGTVREMLEGSEERRAADVFRYMHREILNGSYDATCSNMATALTRGDFNCVTATILFQSLARDVGISATAISVPGHVRSRICFNPGSKTLDVETTCTDWFEPSSKRTPMDAQHSPRELTDVQLLAKIYYNQGVLRLQEEDDAAAIGPLRRALKLDAGDRAARQNLLAAYINGALRLADQKHFEAAADMLKKAAIVTEDDPLLLDNELYVYQRWAVSLCDQGRFAEALTVLESGFDRRPDEVLFRDGRIAVVGLWAQHHLVRGNIDVAFTVLDEQRVRLGGGDVWNGYEVAAILDSLAKLEVARKLDSARQLCARGVQRFPKNEQLQRVQQRLTPLDL